MTGPGDAVPGARSARSRALRAGLWLLAYVALSLGAAYEWSAAANHGASLDARDAPLALAGAALLLAATAIGRYLLLGRLLPWRGLVAAGVAAVVLGPLLFYPVYVAWLIITMLIALLISPLA